MYMWQLDPLPFALIKNNSVKITIQLVKSYNDSVKNDTKIYVWKGQVFQIQSHMVSYGMYGIAMCFISDME